ncbi:hypothetical protein C1646_669659 [Rhizophagus diaphanus]|nr:hypothetical protein C1646_669659 [Rhizophagus diaphanus] [Rhizophagus sp. MUCL 43196]
MENEREGKNKRGKKKLSFAKKSLIFFCYIAVCSAAVVSSSISVLIQKWFKYFFQFGNFEMMTFEAVLVFKDLKRIYGFSTLTISKTEKGEWLPRQNRNKNSFLSKMDAKERLPEPFKLTETLKRFQYLDSQNERMVNNKRFY